MSRIGLSHSACICSTKRGALLEGPGGNDPGAVRIQVHELEKHAGAINEPRHDGMKEETLKGRELHRHLRRTSFSYMDNHRKDAKDVYFRILWYDIAAYEKHW